MARYPFVFLFPPRNPQEIIGSRTRLPFFVAGQRHRGQVAATLRGAGGGGTA
jgi:hypothetical protein